MRRVLLAALLVACGGGQEHPAEPARPAHPAHHAHGPLVHRFDDAARWAREFDDPARAAWQKPEEVVRLLAITPGMTVADLGAGTGYFEPFLSRAVGEAGQVLALDIEDSMVVYMRRRAVREGLGNVRVRKVPFDDPQLPTGAVHRVLVVNTWHHIPERPAYSAKLRAGLAAGGAVFVVDFTPEATHGPPAHARVPAGQVVQELAAAGLHAEILQEDLPEQYVVRAGVPRP